MQVVLLAAGKSKRAKPISDKNLVKICGKRLIEWQVESIWKAGFRNFIIIGNSENLNEMKKLSLPKAEYLWKLQNPSMKGMAGALLSVKEDLENEFLIASTNDGVDEKLWEIVYEKIKSKDENYLVGYHVTRYFPGGYLKLNKKKEIEGIVEKPGEGNEPSELVNLVIHIHHEGKELLRTMEKIDEKKDDRYECALDKMMNRKGGKPFKVISYDGFWQAVKYPWHVLKLTEELIKKVERKIDKTAKISKSAIINGNVHIGKNTRVLDHAVIQGPCYIGDNCVVGNHSLSRNSSLGDNCVVGSFTEICRSNLGDNVWTHKNYIGDSVIGNNVSFGSGTVTGNLRLDEESITVNVEDSKIDTRYNKIGALMGSNIRVGINTSIMPGIKIGSNCMIGAALLVDHDIPENSFVKAQKGIDPQHISSGLGIQFGLDIRKNTKPIAERSKKQ